MYIDVFTSTSYASLEFISEDYDILHTMSFNDMYDN